MKATYVITKGNILVVWENIDCEPSASKRPQQNGLAERSGGVTMAQAHAMRIKANLPHNPRLWILEGHYQCSQLFLQSIHKCHPGIELEVQKHHTRSFTIRTPQHWLVWTQFENLHIDKHTAVEHVQWPKMTRWKGVACANWISNLLQIDNELFSQKTRTWLRKKIIDAALSASKSSLKWIL